MKRAALLYLLILAAGSAVATDTVFSRAVRFTSQGYELHGQLLLPQRNNRVPVIIFLVGSGGNSSYRTNYKRFLHENLELQFLPEGIALFYFDKRGVGASEGKWYETDFHQRADDAKAAIDYLKTLPEVDTTKIGVMGHSQGGWIAQLVAANHPKEVCFMVSLAGPTYGVKKQVINDFESDLVCRGAGKQRAHKKAVRRFTLVNLLVGLAPIKPEWQQLKRIRNYNAAFAVQQLQQPSIFYYAENDALVYPAWALDELKRIFPDGVPGNMEHLTIAGADHGFLLSELCYKGPKKQLRYAPQFQQHLKAWVMRQVR